MTFLLALACTPEEPLSKAPPPAVHDSQARDSAVDDSDPPFSYAGPAYEPCVSDAQCGAGSDCTTVPGFAGAYCAPPCDPSDYSGECDLDGSYGQTTCLDNGRCARLCAEDPEVCPSTLECAEVDQTWLCAGEPFGQAGMYGTCSHPNVEGVDCPPESSCFGGEYINHDSGICLPWCDDGTCPTPPEGLESASPLCYEAGLEHPVCVLLCTPGVAVCPDEQECLDLGFTGICAPIGATSPI